MDYKYLLLLHILIAICTQCLGQNHVLKEIHQTWDSSYLAYKNSYSLSYSYENDTIAEQIFALWDNNLQQFTPHSRDVFSYDEEGKLVLKGKKYWRNNAWAGGLVWEYTYDATGREIHSLHKTYDRESQRYFPYSETLTQNDSLGRPTYQLFLRRESPLLAELVPAFQYYFVYSPDGRSITQTHEVRDTYVPLTWRALATSIHQLDSLGRKNHVRTIFPKGGEQLAIYDYDTQGNITKAVTYSRADSTQDWQYFYGTMNTYQYTPEGWIQNIFSEADGFIFDESYFEGYEKTTQYIHTCDGRVLEYTVHDNRWGPTQASRRVLREYENPAICQGIHDPTFRIIPNPASSRILLDSPLFSLPGTKVRLYTLFGQFLEEFTPLSRSNPFRIDLKVYSPGTYLIEISNGNNREQDKVVIVR